MLNLPIIINDFSDATIYIVHTPSYENLPISVTGAGHFYSHSGYYVERNNLNMYLIMFTIKGKGLLTYRGKTIELNPEHAVLINGMEYHKYHTAPHCSIWEFKWVRFYSPHAQLYDNLINNGGLSLLNIQYTKLSSYCDSIIDHLSGTSSFKCLYSCDLATRMLTSLCSLANSSMINSFKDSDNDVEIARKYILEHYNQSITIQELANLSCMNAQAFIRKFRKSYGITPYTLLKKTRLSKAAYLLESTNMRISEISACVGYQDQNNFSKQFLAQFHQSPTQYRCLFQ